MWGTLWQITDLSDHILCCRSLAPSSVGLLVRHYIAWADAQWRISPQHCYPHATFFWTKICLCVILTYHHRKIASAQKLKHPVQNRGGGVSESTSWHFSSVLQGCQACHIHFKVAVEAPIVGECWRGDCVRPTKWHLQLTATDGTPRLQSNPSTPPHAAAVHHAIIVGTGII